MPGALKIPPPVGDAAVLSYCWCSTDLCRVTWTDVWDGVTKSCGRDCCTPAIMRRNPHGNG